MFFWYLSWLPRCWWGAPLARWGPDIATGMLCCWTEIWRASHNLTTKSGQLGSHNIHIHIITHIYIYMLALPPEIHFWSCLQRVWACRAKTTKTIYNAHTAYTSRWKNILYISSLKIILFDKHFSRSNKSKFLIKSSRQLQNYSRMYFKHKKQHETTIS